MDREQAIEQFKLSLGFLPDLSNTLLELVRCLGELGRAAEAHPFAIRAVEADPESPATWGNLAAVLLDLNRGDEAWDAIKTAEALDPHDPINRQILAACEARFGPRP
jgi:tetratricopeptide (TPR) repeat protein